MPRIIADSELRTKKFEQGADRLRRIGSSTAKGLSRSFASVVGISALGVALDGIASKFDRVGKLAKRFAVPVEDLQRIGFAAEQSGADLETVANAMNRFTRSLADATVGSKRKVQALEELGLSLDALLRMSPAEQFYTFADAVAGAEDEGRAFALTLELMGRGGAELLPALKEGSDGLRELGKALDVVGEADVRAIERLNDTLNKLKTNFAAGAGSWLGSFVNWFQDLAASAAEANLWIGEMVANLKRGESLSSSFLAADEFHARVTGRRLSETIEGDATGGGSNYSNLSDPNWGLKHFYKGTRSPNPSMGIPGLGMGVFGGLLGAVVGGRGAAAAEAHGREMRDAEARHESLRDLLDEMSGSETTLGQFRSVGSLELDPAAAERRAATERIRDAVEESARHLRDLAERDPLAVFATFDG